MVRIHAGEPFSWAPRISTFQLQASLLTGLRADRKGLRYRRVAPLLEQRIDAFVTPAEIRNSDPIERIGKVGHAAEGS